MVFQLQQTQPAKTFYFYGMNNGDSGGVAERAITGVTAEHQLPNDAGDDCGVIDSPINCTNDIAPQLRPVLPKKQYEVPRFSPAAAWRQLASLEARRQNDTKLNKTVLHCNCDYEGQVDCDENSAEEYEDDGDVGEREEPPHCDPPLPYGHINEVQMVVAAAPTANGVVHVAACDDSGISGDGDISPTTNDEHQPRRLQTFNHTTRTDQVSLPSYYHFIIILCPDLSIINITRISNTSFLFICLLSINLFYKTIKLKY